MTLLLFRVDRYGWTWFRTDPSPSVMSKSLTEIWSKGATSEVQAESRRREVRV